MPAVWGGDVGGCRCAEYTTVVLCDVWCVLCTVKRIVCMYMREGMPACSSLDRGMLVRVSGLIYIFCRRQTVFK